MHGWVTDIQLIRTKAIIGKQLIIILLNELMMTVESMIMLVAMVMAVE